MLLEVIAFSTTGVLSLLRDVNLNISMPFTCTLHFQIVCKSLNHCTDYRILFECVGMNSISDDCGSTHKIEPPEHEQLIMLDRFGSSECLVHFLYSSLSQFEM
jgi:hypothetical protein